VKPAVARARLAARTPTSRTRYSGMGNGNFFRTRSNKLS
jgi:hypothetical protein